jgi:hypothetical protein
MGVLWIEEGMRQFRLGLAWRTLHKFLEAQQGGAKPPLCPRKAQVTAASAALPQPAPAARAPAPAVPQHGLPQLLAERVLNPFLEQEWIPGLEQALDRLPRKHEPSDLQTVADQLDKSFAAQCAHRSPADQGEMDLEKQRDAVAAALEACLDAVWDERGSAGLAPLPGASMFVPRDQAIFRWHRQGAALADWQSLRSRFLAPQIEDYAARGEIAASTDQLADSVRGFLGRAGGKKGSRLGSGPRWLRRRLAESHHVLGLCVQALETIHSGLADADRREALQGQQALLDWIDSELRRCPDDWPPAVLAALASDLRQLAPQSWASLLHREPSPADAAQWNRSLLRLGCSRENQARIGLIWWLAAGGDALRDRTPLPPTAWARLQQAADQLLAGGDLRVLLLHDPSCTGAGVKPPTRGPANLPPRVLVTGLLGQRGEEPVCVREAEIQLPTAMSAVVAPLRRLAEMAAAIDPTLCELARLLCNQLQDCPNIRDWWQKHHDIADQRLIWQVLQRVAGLPPTEDELNTQVARVLEAFDDEEVRFASPDALGSDPQSSKPMFVWTCGKQEGAPTGWRAIAVQLPDGTATVPTVLLRVPRGWMQQRPLMSWLAEHEALWTELRLRDPQWHGWQKYGDCAWKLSYGGGLDTSLDNHLAVGAELFEAVFQRAHDGGCPWREYYFPLASSLYQCLLREDYPLVPALDPQTLKCQPMAGPPQDGTEVCWVPSSEVPYGTPIRVERFGWPGTPGRLSLSLGDKCAAQLARWLALPVPDLVPGQGEAGCPLAAWHRQLQQLPWHGQRIEKHLAAAAAGFGGWLASGPGQTWLDAFLHEVRDPSCRPVVRQWFEVLCEAGWLHVLPIMDAQSGAVRWPPDVSTAGRGLRWRFDTALPVGTLIGDHVRFSSSAELAEGVFSLGPPVQGGALEFACALDERLDAAGEQGLLDDAFRPVAGAVRDWHFGIAEPETIVQRVSAALAMLASLTESPPAESAVGGSAFTALDTVYSVFERLCEACGLTLTPPHWSFSNPPPPDQWGNSGLRECQARFSEQLTRGQARITRFGLAVEGSVRQEIAAWVSAGPPPPGYQGLRSALRAMGDSAAALSAQVDAWPQEQLNDKLKSRVIAFFMDFWGRFGDELRAPTEPPVASPQKDCLRRVDGCLQEALGGLGLQVFRPKHSSQYGDDWKNWLEVSSNKPILKAEGKLQVLRPGIANSEGQCLLPAKVLLE